MNTLIDLIVDILKVARDENGQSIDQIFDEDEESKMYEEYLEDWCG